VDPFGSDDGVADLQALRRQDIGLFAIGVADERDEGGAVRIVLQTLDRARDVKLAALEVDDAVQLLGAAAAEADSDTARSAAAARLRQAFDQRLFRLALVQLRAVHQNELAAAGRGRIELL